MGLTHKQKEKNMLRLLALMVLLIGIQACATVGAVLDGGKELTTGVVDATVGTVAGVSAAALEDVSDVVGTAADAVGGVVDTVATEIDKQTDELQEPKEEGK
jgi:hypothetical protein